MVVLADKGRINVSRLTSVNNGLNTRKHTRLSLRIALFLRRPFNSPMYAKAVQTIDVSANGLLVACDINLEIGADLEVTSVNRDVIVKAIVKHTSKDPITGKYLIGLSIVDVHNRWFVQQPFVNQSISGSLATEAIC